jgi:hypothetical protein
MKEAWKRQRDSSNTSTGFTVWEGALWRGTPEESWSPSHYRLEVDIGEWSGGEIPLVGNFLLEWSQPSLGEARGDNW